MKRIGTKTATKGKKSVTLDVYSYDNIITFADTKKNYYKIVHETSYDKAQIIFYEWVMKMHNIKTELTLYKPINE